ncbi:MAG: hypothetical protein KF758_08450 [Anaerolineales bacterium]|nr:hypothetical protein [Anaerolineales bacterium]MBX3036929.1 hypothetical protein [Anaerolineales bacterium]
MKNKFLFLFFIITLTLSACGAGDSAGASQTVEGYITALASKDEASLISNSCAAWEESALLELDSLELVEVSLADGVACQEVGNEGDTTLVNCTGKLQMSYGGEPQELDFSKITYEVVNENGNWLVCGTR